MSVFIILLSLIAACAGVATWALTVVVIPVITELRFAWPSDLIWLWPCLLVGGFLMMFLLLGISWYASWWTHQVPTITDAPEASALSGAAVGAFVATCMVRAPWGIVLGVATTALLAFLAVRALRATIDDFSGHHEEVERLDELHDHGTLVRADVEKVEFLDSWNDGLPLFEVTVSYDTPSGRRRATGLTTSSPAGAPTVGGTVRLWFLGSGDDTDNIDIDEDPRSIREPGAAERYEIPSI